MKVTFDLRIAPRVFPFSYATQLGRSFYARTPSYQHHDDLSLHSVGWIRGGADATRRGLVFNASSTWSLGVVHKDVLEEFLASVDDDPEIIPGVRVRGVRPVPPPTGRVRYLAESPILLRRGRDDGGRDHLAYDDPEADARLTHTLRAKLGAIGLPPDVQRQAHASFDRAYAKARTKVVTVKGNRFRANVCPVILDAPDPLLHELAMSTGLGALTGMGLGAIVPDATR
jgi:CRISPR-associated endoribonuclease Cas6